MNWIIVFRAGRFGLTDRPRPSDLIVERGERRSMAAGFRDYVAGARLVAS